MQVWAKLWIEHLHKKARQRANSLNDTSVLKKPLPRALARPFSSFPNKFMHLTLSQMQSKTANVRKPALWVLAIARRAYRCVSPSARDTGIKRFMDKTGRYLTIGYDEQTEVLHIEYPNGALYQATGVSVRDYNAWRAARDRNAGFDDHILRRHSFEKIAQLTPMLPY